MASKALTAIFGDELIGKSGPVKTSEALSGMKHVMIYFSAHWCPPCRGFTPKLVDKYNSYGADKGVEVVFVSSDRDQATFRNYYGEMPWLAVPFADHGRKGALSSKYEVQGIPSLIVLDAYGNLVTAEGRAQVDQYLGVLALPAAVYGPASFPHLFGGELMAKSGSVKTEEALDGKKLIFIYFGAYGSPPCRGVAPALARKYRARAAAKAIEVIFVSSDQDQANFQRYHSEMPWLAMPFGDRARAQLLGQKFGVQGVPSLIVLDSSGNLVTKAVDLSHVQALDF
eukprot:CAMPEP_0197635188 /NCGR_PEP_ID=MMETSP1338-20131121/11074_1 /TAXON_ID=43686 ORGANISM="Pelagodinium beii, Strain RCC1491" /NCGR_SAMPLE_ID=MMETSP1338 /ASSEMBLY_ACC=CAM_ASM_000754 /LENGTH=283 /DNA_ID=CAMNT_0043207191 /DNA_START=36 /DNA_END=887 /DNA_ORIENTATION=-